MRRRSHQDRTGFTINNGIDGDSAEYGNTGIFSVWDFAKLPPIKDRLLIHGPHFRGNIKGVAHLQFYRRPELVFLGRCDM